MNNGKQAAEKSSQAPNSVESKPVQLTLQEYMASEEASDSKSGETVKKSKGLYVASDDSDWAGIVISVPKSAEKDQQQKVAFGPTSRFPIYLLTMKKGY